MHMSLCALPTMINIHVRQALNPSILENVLLVCVPVEPQSKEKVYLLFAYNILIPRRRELSKPASQPQTFANLGFFVPYFDLLRILFATPP